MSSVDPGNEQETRVVIGILRPVPPHGHVGADGNRLVIIEVVKVPLPLGRVRVAFPSYPMPPKSGYFVPRSVCIHGNRQNILHTTN